MRRPPPARRPRPSATAAARCARPDCPDRTSLQAVFEAAFQVLAVEVAADEDKLARALLAVLPGLAPVGIHHHMHALIDVAPRRAVDRQDALAAEDVGAAQLQERAHPFLEFVGIDRPVGSEAEALHPLFVVVVMAVLEEIRLELQDALQVEGALVEDGVESDPALLGPVKPGARADALVASPYPLRLLA